MSRKKKKKKRKMATGARQSKQSNPKRREEEVVIKPAAKEKEREEEMSPFVKEVFKLLAEAGGNVDFLYLLTEEWFSNFVNKHGDKAMDMILSGLSALKKTDKFPWDLFYVILDVMVEEIKDKRLAGPKHKEKIAETLKWEEIKRDLSVSRRLCLILRKLDPKLAAEAEAQLEKADQKREPESFEIDTEPLEEKFIKPMIDKHEGGDCEATLS